jgi:hypothetical protein
MQLLIGISTSFLNAPFAAYNSLADKTWFTSVWRFSDKLGITLSITNAWLPPAPQGQDVNLMEYFSSQNIHPSHLKSINRCRIYLQVLNLSDIVSADARTIIPQVLVGEKLINRRVP